MHRGKLHHWVFSTKVTNKDRKTGYLDLFNMGYLEIKRHRKIIAKATPFDPEYKTYFKQRKLRQKKGSVAKTIPHPVNYHQNNDLKDSQMISFKWRHFQEEIIMLVVRWYLSYALSYRDIEEMMLERKINVDHSTINRWVIHYSPLLEEEFRKNNKRKTGSSWRMNETYIKVKGVWLYLYRAVDKFGATIDFMLSIRGSLEEPTKVAGF